MNGFNLKTKGCMLCLLAFVGLCDIRAQDTIVGGLEAYVDQFLSSMPGAGGNDYSEPTTFQIMTWERAIQHYIQKEYQLVSDSLSVLNYRLVYFHDTIHQSNHYLFEKTINGTNHWGLYAFNLNPCLSNIIIQSPHPKHDTNTGKQGVYVYLNSNVYAWMISGTHRCNSAVVSACDGSTRTCSATSQPYTISDMAHNVNSMFFATTTSLHRYVSEPYFLQLHGFGQNSTDPYMIFSNCSRSAPPNEDKLLELAQHLMEIDTVLDYEIPHINLNWNRLIGFTNVQGRFINQAQEPCTDASPTNQGRFFHLEQERTRLRLTATEWDKMAQAVTTTFSSMTLDADTIYQDVIAAKDTLEVFSFDSLTTHKLIFQAEDAIILHPNTCFPAQDIDFIIK